MTLDEYDAFCVTLPHATMVVQWGNAHVWKIAGEKVFAIGWHSDSGGGAEREGAWVTFKVSPLSFALLREQEGCRPAPYLASRGMSWIQRTNGASLDDATLKSYLVESHRLVAAGFSKKRQRELGLA